MDQFSGGRSPLDAVDVHEFPEARDLWDSRRVTKLPSPYYGFETTDFQEAHGPGGWAEFSAWLERNHPKEYPLFRDRVPLEPPSPAVDYYTSSYKSALPAELHPVKWAADRSIDFLKDATSDDNHQPFLLWFSTELPHVPMAPPAPYCYRYNPKDVPPPIRSDDETYSRPTSVGYTSKRTSISLRITRSARPTTKASSRRSTTTARRWVTTTCGERVRTITTASSASRC